MGEQRDLGVGLEARRAEEQQVPSSLRAALTAAGVAVDVPLVDERPSVGATVQPAVAPAISAISVGSAATPAVAPQGAPLLVATPPDWYRDPTGRFDHRWFDGERWTDQVARGGERRTDPLR